MLADSDIWGLITYNYNKYVLACPISTLAARLQLARLVFIISVLWPLLLVRLGLDDLQFFKSKNSWDIARSVMLGHRLNGFLGLS